MQTELKMLLVGALATILSHEATDDARRRAASRIVNWIGDLARPEIRHEVASEYADVIREQAIELGSSREQQRIMSNFYYDMAINFLRAISFIHAELKLLVAP